MASAVSRACASVCLPSLAIVQGLPAKRPLIDLPLVCTRKWETVVLELYHCLGRLSAHVLDGVLHKNFASPDRLQARQAS